MAKTVPAESISAGVTRMVGAMFPKHGNNTEARRAEKPQTTVEPRETSKPERPTSMPMIDKAIEDAGG